MAKTPKLSHHFAMQTGDYSGDGHNMRDVETFVANYSLEDIKQAYEVSCLRIGVDVIDDCCEEYEDNKIPHSVLEKLVNAGIKDIVVDEDEEGWDYVCSQDWNYLILQIAKISLPDLEWEEEKHSTWDVGGYGLFSQ